MGPPQGDGTLDEPVLQLAAMLTLQLEMMESRWATTTNGEAGRTQIDDYQRCSNTLRRLLEAVGLQRRPKDITPSLDQYLRMKAQSSDDDEVTEAAE